MRGVNERGNIDPETVEGFGDEWALFDQQGLDEAEHRRLFEQYFEFFPFEELSSAEGFDLGCGSGRWAALVAPRVGKLHCIDPASKALAVSRRALRDRENVEFHEAGADDIPLAENSQDFGYSLGVLHHIPDTEAAMRNCVAKLRPGAPFLVYLYYRLENRPFWFRAMWHASDLARRTLSRLPFGARRLGAETLAALAYLPLARASRRGERLGFDVSNWPLSHYRDVSYYTMRTDALDRFGTRLERRFTRKEIGAMMKRCGLVDIRFRAGPPYWVAVGRKAAASSSPAVRSTISPTE